MKNSAMKKRIASITAAAVMTVTGVSGTVLGTAGVLTSLGTSITAYAASSVEFTASKGCLESIYAEWAPVSNATGYNVYCDGTQIDSMLIRQYSGYFRADVVGLKAGAHTLKVVPVIGGKEDASKASSVNLTASAHDRSGYAFQDGHTPGAYKADGTLKDNAIVVYVTNENKDTVTVNLNVEGKGEVACTGVQNIILGYKKGKETRPIAIRFIGNVTDPSTLTKGDLYIDSAKAGMTIEGIGDDATINGYGLIMKNAVDVEIRNVAFMLCNSDEGDNCGLQQSNSYCWVHNCDFFYGLAGKDADQAKGDGALDTKKSHHITHSYNHFFDSGKCNLQGANASDTSNYITYHHNWYDHSDSRHPRVRVATVHVYNNYYDGNSKYGIGSTTDSDIFAENNYFRNCKSPMMISGQGTDAAGEGTFSGEVGGMIKAYGNIMEGGTFVPYSQNNTQFDAYDASSREEQVPASVKAASGGASYNNFDTASDMYSYNLDKAEDVPSVVMAKAGRVDGGDFKWTFNNAVDDEDYGVNKALKDALIAYDDSIVAIGSGFKEDSGTETPVVTTAAPVVTDIVTTTTKKPSTPTPTPTPITGSDVIYCSPNGSGDGKTMNTPTDVLSAISAVKAGGTIYLLEGTYKFNKPIIIDQNNSGSANALKTISAYPGANVVFDFSEMGTSNSNRGIVLDGSYWKFYGFEITKAGDNGMLLSGNNNRIEMMVFNDNQDTGLQISRYRTDCATIDTWPSYNYILNCTAMNNCDDKTMENADGFAAKLTCGEGNIFDGCMAYNNSDDGWDLYAKAETGPTGVVTIQNSVAFRNGFTEFGEGYGGCDGNGFKLGGGGVGTRHVVKNCLAFENLNCGFTDNNNPEFGDMTNCTAYNNGVGGNGKANYMVYRCSSSATFANMMSYTNTSKVSNIGAAGIKLSNDKFVGKMTNSVYYNGKYYLAKSETMTNGAKLGTVITPTDSDFITLSVPAMGTDFHTAWRNSDGSVNTGGFAETNGTYKELGYHFDGSTVTPPTPVVTTTVKPVTPVQTTTTTASPTKPVTPPVSGGYVHDFTANGTSSSYYTITGNLSTSKGTVEYGGKKLTQCLKMETATNVTFNAASDGKITLVFVEPAATVKIDGTKYTSSGDGIITVDLNAGSHTITKADAANLFYMVYSESTSTPSTTPSTEAPTENPDKVYGDADLSGDLSISDAVIILSYSSNSEKVPLNDEAKDLSDVFNRGDGIDAMDALSVQKRLTNVIVSLPESYLDLG